MDEWIASKIAWVREQWQNRGVKLAAAVGAGAVAIVFDPTVLTTIMALLPDGPLRMVVLIVGAFMIWYLPTKAQESDMAQMQKMIDKLRYELLEAKYGGTDQVDELEP